MSGEVKNKQERARSHQKRSEVCWKNYIIRQKKRKDGISSSMDKKEMEF